VVTDLVPVDARQFTGDNGPAIREWMNGGPLLSPNPSPGDWVMRVGAGFRTVPAALFATTYRPGELA
jgi:hypothetical protein